jgi:hypothetical protein
MIDQILKYYYIAARLITGLLKKPYRHKFLLIIKVFDFLKEYDISAKLLMLLMELRPQDFVVAGFDKEKGLVAIIHKDTGLKFQINKKDWLRILIDKSNK